MMYLNNFQNEQQPMVTPEINQLTTNKQMAATGGQIKLTVEEAFVMQMPKNFNAGFEGEAGVA